MTTPEFLVTEEDLGADRHMVAVRGELSLYTASEVSQKLVEAIECGKTRIVVDLTETTYIDDSGLGVLTAKEKRLRNRGGGLALVFDPQSHMARLFEITGHDMVLTIRPTREDAIAALDADASAG